MEVKHSPKRILFKGTVVQIAPVEDVLRWTSWALSRSELGGSLSHLWPLRWTGGRFKSFAWLYVTLSVWLYFNLSVHIYFLRLRLLFRGK